VTQKRIIAMDFVADVMKNADAARVAIASRQLQNFARDRVGIKTLDRSHKTVDPAENSNPTFKRQFTVAVGEEQVGLANVKSRTPPRDEVMRNLETLLATKVVEAMLPKDQSRLYGEGTSGEIWRGLHIETMGKALASKGMFANLTGDPMTLGSLVDEKRWAGTIVPFAR
jgi:hypothetical protein